MVGSLIPRPALAQRLVGLYLGGAVGQAQIRAHGEQVVTPTTFYDESGSFSQSHVGFKALAGVHVLFLGAEAEYLHFGSASGPFNAYGNGRADTSMDGGALFALLHLPLPLIDPFVKAGVARINSTIEGTAQGVPNCPSGANCAAVISQQPFRLERTDTHFAAGAGIELKLGRGALRAEYEWFDAAGAHPTFASLGFTWSLL